MVPSAFVGTLVGYDAEFQVLWRWVGVEIAKVEGRDRATRAVDRSE